MTEERKTGMSTGQAVQCKTDVLGPRVGSNVVLWRRRCKNRTRHPSGYCHLHRLADDRGMRTSGPGAIR